MVRLIELFAGIGSQSKALKNLGIEFEPYRVVEFDKFAMASYNKVHGTHFDTSDITKISASDLGIVDTDEYTYVMTYSFPCQDLSLAGKKAGMVKGSGTRSGLLWEVERLLNECEELPQILLMENVTQVHGKKNREDFDKWCEYLESKGYHNFWKDLNAKNYGIPQNRNRCFMVSFLNRDTFEFPKEIPLTLRVKDLLEDNVDEKYYLKQKALEYILDSHDVALNGGRNINNKTINPSISKTISCRGAADQRADVTNFVIDGTSEEVTVGEYKSLWTPLQEQMITDEGNVKRYVGSDKVDEFNEGQCADISFPNGYNKGKRTHDECPAINPTTSKHSFCVKEPTICASRGRNPLNPNSRKVGEPTKQRIELGPDGLSNCLTTVQKDNYVLEPPYRIRKLTPLECWRLMGFDDEDFYKAQEVNSNTQLYKQAGNSIVVDVLEAIFSKIFEKSEENLKNDILDLL